MACGERYQDLLTVNGNPADKPCGIWSNVGGCTTAQATAWNARADEVWYLVRAAWNSLMDLENARQDWTLSRSLRPQVDEFERSAENMVRWSWLSIEFNTTVVDSAVGVVRQGACALDRLNNAIASLNGGSIEPGASSESPPLFPPAAGNTLLLVAVAAAAAFFLWSQR